MDINKLPGVMKQLNEGLDELILAMGKVGSLYESARQISPVLEDITKMISTAGEGTKQVHTQNRTRSSQVHTSVRKRRRSRY